MNQSRHTKSDGFIVASQWLSELFGTPVSVAHIEQTLTQPAQQTLGWLAEQLDVAAEMHTILSILQQDHSNVLAVHLQRRYTTLFEGIFRNRAVLPYESAWSGKDTAIPEMHALLRALEMHVSEDCCEPADHLAIELAALAYALHAEHYPIAIQLLNRLQNWTPGFAQALQQQDKDGFYAAAADILVALLNKASNALAAYVPNQYEGEFA